MQSCAQQQFYKRYCLQKICQTKPIWFMSYLPKIILIRLYWFLKYWNFRNPQQSDWLRAFWAITQDLVFWKTWNLKWKVKMSQWFLFQTVLTLCVTRTYIYMSQMSLARGQRHIYIYIYIIYIYKIRHLQSQLFHFFAHGRIYTHARGQQHVFFVVFFLALASTIK